MLQEWEGEGAGMPPNSYLDTREPDHETTVTRVDFGYAGEGAPKTLPTPQSPSALLRVTPCPSTAWGLPCARASCSACAARSAVHADAACKGKRHAHLGLQSTTL